jgi:hypothetical protein
MEPSIVEHINPFELGVGGEGIITWARSKQRGWYMSCAHVAWVHGYDIAAISKKLRIFLHYFSAYSVLDC